MAKQLDSSVSFTLQALLRVNRENYAWKTYSNHVVDLLQALQEPQWPSSRHPGAQGEIYPVPIQFSSCSQHVLTPHRSIYPAPIMFSTCSHTIQVDERPHYGEIGCRVEEDGDLCGVCKPFRTCSQPVPGFRTFISEKKDIANVFSTCLELLPRAWRSHQSYPQIPQADRDAQIRRYGKPQHWQD